MAKILPFYDRKTTTLAKTHGISYDDALLRVAEKYIIVKPHTHRGLPVGSIHSLAGVETLVPLLTRLKPYRGGTWVYDGTVSDVPGSVYCRAIDATADGVVLLNGSDDYGSFQGYTLDGLDSFGVTEYDYYRGDTAKGVVHLQGQVWDHPGDKASDIADWVNSLY